jgi:hypothetical protein
MALSNSRGSHPDVVDAGRKRYRENAANPLAEREV